MWIFSWLEKKRQKKEEKRIVKMAIQNIENLKKTIQESFENYIHFHHYESQIDRPLAKKKKKVKQGKKKKWSGNVDKYLRDRCYFDDGIMVGMDEVFEDYVDWAQQNGLKYCKCTNSFGRELAYATKGRVNSIREGQEVIYRGFGIRSFCGDLFL